MEKYLNYRLLLKYLFIPGLIIAIAGIVAGVITKTWTPLYVGLVIAGSVIVGIWLIFIFAASQGFWQKRSTQAGTNALISTLSLIAILGLINFLAVRYSHRIDFSENQLFTLSPQSQEIVKSLDQPVKVWVFDSKPNPTDRKLLEDYRRYNPNFTFEFVDPDVKIGLTKQFGVKSLGDVYVEFEGKKQLAQTLMAFGQREPLSEIKLTNTLEKVQRDRTPTVYFLQGHGELSLEPAGEGSISDVAASLKDKGYNVAPLNLVERSAIPDDADTIVIAGTKGKLFAQEVQALKAYANAGGNLLLLLDPQTDSGLEPVLKDWGVELDDRVIIDATSALGPAIPLINNYGTHPITKELANRYSFYPLARPIDTVKVKNVEAVALLVASDRMWAESDLSADKEIEFNSDKDIAGPFDLGVALTKTIDKKDKPEKQESRMVVIGNSAFATNNFFNEQFNSDVFLNTVQWLANKDEQTLSIRPKEPANRRINLTPIQASLLAWLSLVIVPIFGLVMAIFTWWRRR